MGIIGKNIIVGIIWLTILSLMVITQTSQLFLALLFTLFVLNFSKEITSTFINKEYFQKIASLILSLTIFSTILIALFYSFKYMAIDLRNLIETSQPLIINTIKSYGIEDIENIEAIYETIIKFFKENLSFITSSATLLFKVFIGMILGVIFYFSDIGVKSNETLEGAVINDLKKYSSIIFNSFKNIMKIQVLVSLMNTTIIASMALGLTYIIYGEFLPYWYVIIPLTAILSLIPVVGNILINIILVMATIQMSPFYVILGVGLFLVIHKLELLVIGQKMKEKVDIPFMFILISMLLGELLFHSMSGMLLGMVMMVSVAHIMRNIPYKAKESKKIFKGIIKKGS